MNWQTYDFNAMQRQQNTNFFGCCLLFPVASFPVFSHWMSNCHLSNTSSVSTCVITMTTRWRLFCSSQSKKSNTKGESISKTISRLTRNLNPVSSGITDEDCSKNNWHIVMKITRLMCSFRMLLKHQPNATWKIQARTGFEPWPVRYGALPFELLQGAQVIEFTITHSQIH